MQQNYTYVSPYSQSIYPSFTRNESSRQVRPYPNRPGARPQPNRFGGGFVLPFALGFLSAPLLTGGVRPYPYRPYQYGPYYPYY